MTAQDSSITALKASITHKVRTLTATAQENGHRADFSPDRADWLLPLELANLLGTRLLDLGHDPQSAQEDFQRLQAEAFEAALAVASRDWDTAQDLVKTVGRPAPRVEAIAGA